MIEGSQVVLFYEKLPSAAAGTGEPRSCGSGEAVGECQFSSDTTSERPHV